MSAKDDRIPVLVGAAAIQQREPDPELALEPIELMARALEAAAHDAGAPALLARAGRILAPRGFWGYPDPCRVLAERFGAAGARTVVSELGVLQTTLFGIAAAEIASGRADVVLVTGAEAKHRDLQARIAGRPAPLRSLPLRGADEVLRPQGEILSKLEIEGGLLMPVAAFAMIENAMRAADGQTLDAHRREVAELWAGFSRIAARNPDAWSREPVSADAILDPGSAGNRMLAFPYTKLHNSQWNVDQAAGLVFCSLATARALGVAEDRFVFPIAVADSNHMLSLPQRRELHRCPGFRHAGRRVLERAGVTPDDVAHLELYSCFPAAVRSQLREIGIAADRPLSVTGGMPFAGGPLNNFVLQALAKMAQVLRAEPGSLGLVTAVSGLLAKQGASLWSSEARGEFHFDDVSAATAADVEDVEAVGEANGDARIASYTVTFAGDAPSHATLLCDLPDGRRALLRSDDPTLIETLLCEEGCGLPIHAEGSTARAA